LTRNKKDIETLETTLKSRKSKAEADLAKAQADLATLTPVSPQTPQQPTPQQPTPQQPTPQQPTPQQPTTQFPRLTVDFRADGTTTTLQKAVTDYKAALQRLSEGFQIQKDAGPPPPLLVESEVVAGQQAIYLANFNIYLEGNAAFDLADSVAKTPANKAAVAADRQKWEEGLRLSLPTIKSYFCRPINTAGETRHGRITAAGQWPAGIPNPCTA
jgi:hypothetical protein